MYIVWFMAAFYAHLAYVYYITRVAGAETDWNHFLRILSAKFGLILDGTK